MYCTKWERTMRKKSTYSIAIVTVGGSIYLKIRIVNGRSEYLGMRIDVAQEA